MSDNDLLAIVVMGTVLILLLGAAILIYGWIA